MRTSLAIWQVARLGSFLSLVLFTRLTSIGAAGDLVTAIPAGTDLHFHLTQAVSSTGNKRGDPFTFVMLAPIHIGGTDVVAAGAVGSGTLLVVGHAGGQGHEGDLTFELDSVPTVDGRIVAFDAQRFEINRRNRKVVSNVLGFAPYIGLAAMLIKGSNERVDPSQAIESTLLRSAPISTITLKPDSAPA